MTDWQRDEFGYWLRLQRRVEKPMSQENLADKVGITQAKISRWELDTPNTDAPTLDECLRLADIFDADFIELARMVGRWNTELERRVLAAYGCAGAKKGLNEAPIIHELLKDSEVVTDIPLAA